MATVNKKKSKEKWFNCWYFDQRSRKRRAGTQLHYGNIYSGAHVECICAAGRVRDRRSRDLNTLLSTIISSDYCFSRSIFADRRSTNSAARARAATLLVPARSLTATYKTYTQKYKPTRFIHVTIDLITTPPSNNQPQPKKPNADFS